MPIAHAGHWLLSLLYLAPVLIVVAVVAWQGRRDRDRDPDDERDEDEGEPTLDDIMDGRA